MYPFRSLYFTLEIIDRQQVATERVTCCLSTKKLSLRTITLASLLFYLSESKFLSFITDLPSGVYKWSMRSL